MDWWLPIAATAPFILVLIASGFWANAHFAEFDELPRHFDWRGRATAFASRSMMAWALPVGLTVAMVLLALLITLTPPELRNGEPVTGVLIMGTGFVAAQLFVLWLTCRWAKQANR